MFKSKIINFQTLFASIIIAISLIGSASAASILTGFEDGTSGPASGYFYPYESGRTHGPDKQEMEIVSGKGAEGTNYCLKDTVTEGNMYLYYIPDPDKKNFIPQAENADRMSFYIKLPENYPLRSDYNFHVGTYTHEPQDGDIFNNGQHYYHYFNVPGSKYWTKVVCNEHPTHQTAVKEDPGNNPESWDYFTGFTRFYLDMVPESQITLPWSGYVDQVKFYKLSEPENNETINNISCTYMGKGRFIIGWHGNSQYDHNGHSYEVRYSTDPITNANYSEANKLPGNPKFSKSDDEWNYNYIKAEFTITVQENERYYFAIKDLDSDIPYVSKINYLAPADILNSPSNLRVIQ